MFAEAGVEASVEEIARRAGLGIRTLYRHFTTREALVEAIFEVDGASPSEGFARGRPARLRT